MRAVPIAAWKCPVCFKSSVPLDHFAVSNCGLAVHPDYVSAVLATQEPQYGRDEFTHEPRVRVSSTAGCPRSAAIMHTEKVTADPLAFNSMLTGTAWHQLMEINSIDPDETEVEVSGIIDGIPLVSHIDRILKFNDQLVIADWKHANDFNRKYLKDKAKDEHIVQTSLYAELYHQMHEERPTRGVNWYHFTSSPPFIPMWYDLWSVEKCLEHKPYGCEFTVQQILHQGHDFISGKVKWQELPLVGEGFQFNGKTGCDYCLTRDLCWEESKGDPF